MEKATKISSFRLSSLLRLQKDPNLALNLFLNPNPNPNFIFNPKPFRYSLLSYDLIITKLGRAKMFKKMEQILEMLKQETRFVPKEIIFCNVINFYARGRLPNQALTVFDQITSFGCKRTIRSVNTLLNALLSCREYEKTMEIFEGIGKYADPDVCTYNILINACFLGGDVEGAWKVFGEMRKGRFRPNVVTFGTLINGLCANSKLEEALGLKDTMIRVFKLKPNAFVYAALIKGLCKVNKLSAAIELKDEILENGEAFDSSVYASLITSLFRAGRRGDAIELVEELRQKGCQIDTVAYNAIISGFCLENDFDAAFLTLNEMENKGCKPDVITYNIVFGGLCREGLLEEAINLCRDMPRRGCVPDIVTYRILFDGLCDGIKLKKAAVFLDEMVLKGFAPRSESVTIFFNKLVQGGDLELMWTVVDSMGKGNLMNMVIWEMLIPLVCQKHEQLKESELVNILVMS